MIRGVRISTVIGIIACDAHIIIPVQIDLMIARNGSQSRLPGKAGIGPLRSKLGGYFIFLSIHHRTDAGPANRPLRDQPGILVGTTRNGLAIVVALTVIVRDAA